MKTHLIVLVFLILRLCSCSWYSFELHSVSQPILFGSQVDSTAADSIGIISGLFIHEKEEETYSQSGSVTISIGGKDYTKENINSAIKAALQDDPKRFIANGEMVIDVEHGISTGTILSSILASIITSEDSETGHYTDESIYFRGTVYRLKNQKKKNE